VIVMHGCNYNVSKGLHSATLFMALCILAQRLSIDLLAPMALHLT